MKTDCNVSKKTIEKAYDEYIMNYGTDLERFTDVGIKFEEKDALWRLWILALMYQGMSEEASETIFKEIPEDSLTFNPSTIWQKAEECGCPLLLEANKVRFCDFSLSTGCSESQFFNDCPIPIIRAEIRRFSRISKAIVSSAIYLRDYDFDFEKLYASLQQLPINERTQKILNVCQMIGDEKIAHMYLRWLSNSVPNNWELDAKRFLAIDVNITKVAKNIGLCKSSNTSVTRAYMQELLKELGMNDPKDTEKIEIALLHIGQEYCSRQRRIGCTQKRCLFY